MSAISLAYKERRRCELECFHDAVLSKILSSYITDLFQHLNSQAYTRRVQIQHAELGAMWYKLDAIFLLL